MVLPGGLHKLHPSAAGGGEGGKEGAELAVGQLLILSAPGRQRDQIPRRSGLPLGVGHRVHQGQDVQQQAGPLPRRGGQQLCETGVNLAKYRAGSGQRF